MGKWAREGLECCRPRVVGGSGGNSEIQNAARSVKTKTMLPGEYGSDQRPFLYIWQRTWPHFVQACEGRCGLKVID